MENKLILLVVTDPAGDNDFGGMAWEEHFERVHPNKIKPRIPNSVFEFEGESNTEEHGVVDGAGYECTVEVTSYNIRTPQHLFKILKDNDLSFDYDALKHTYVQLYEVGSVEHED